MTKKRQNQKRQRMVGTLMVAVGSHYWVVGAMEEALWGCSDWEGRKTLAVDVVGIDLLEIELHCYSLDEECF